MFRGSLIAALVCAAAFPALGDDRAVCASFAVALRGLADAAEDFSSITANALPDYLAASPPSLETERAAYLSAASAVPGAAGPMGEYAAALIRLRGPLDDYRQKLSDALVAAEACASR